MNQQGHAPPDGPEWLIRPHLAALKPYNPIVPPELLEEETSVPSSGIIKLDGNENPYGPSPRVHEALARLATPHLYPTPSPSGCAEHWATTWESTRSI